MASIDYSAGSRVVNEQPHAVYAKATWDADWTAMPNLSCLECLWTAAPGVNTARLRWELGNVILPGDSTPTSFSAWAGRGQFVRIDWLCDDGSTILRWVGFVDSTSSPSEAFGHQEIVAYGLERALALTYISRSVWWDATEDETAVSEIALPFNGPIGLRTEDPDDDDIYYFRDPRLELPADENTTPWSTREIVRYLLTQLLPTNNFGVVDIPWAFIDIDLLPDWDSPRVDTEFRTVWDVLNELVNASRLFGFTVGNDGSATVAVKFFTHVASDLTVSGNTVPANPTQHTLVTVPDALTEAFYSDVGGGYDQVICRGAKKQVICTIDVATMLVKSWTDDQQTEYETAASGEAGYSTMTDADKRRSNARVRKSPKLAKVFRVYRLKPDIHSTYQPFTKFCSLMNRLPFKQDKDWTGAVDTTHFDRDGEGSPIFVTFEDKETSTVRVPMTALGAMYGGSKRSAVVRVKCAGREVHFDVIGAEQHTLSADFSPLAVDEGEYIVDQEKAELTLSVEHDTHIEGKYPSSSPSANIVRRLVVDVGDDYQFVEILPLTTVSMLKFDGSRDYSDGGTLVDDTNKLNALARFVAESYALTRKTVAWRSQRKIGSVAVGDLITTADGATINSPVLAVSISGGVSINRLAPATIQGFECHRGSADPFSLLASMKSAKPKALPMRVVDTGAKRNV